MNLGAGASVLLQGFRPEVHSAVEAVARALEIAMSGAGASEVTSKGGRDLVTAADVAVEDAVRALLTASLGLTVVGEERGGQAPADGSAYWLVDPICGTTNFAAGMTLYCVNLALVEQGQVVAAVVGDPSTASICVAQRGRGSWSLQNGALEPIHANAESRTVVVEDGKSTGARRAHAGRCMAAVVAADRWHFRSPGSTIALPYFAAARVAAYVVFYVTAVHSAAGSLLATEAGGVLTDVFGRPWTLESDSLLAAATPELHAELLELVYASAV